MSDQDGSHKTTNAASFAKAHPYLPTVYFPRLMHDRSDLAAQLTATAWPVLWWLCERADWQTGQHAYPSVATLVQATGRSKPSVRAALKLLCRLGLATRQGKVQVGSGQWVWTYDLHRPAKPKAEKGASPLPPSPPKEGKSSAPQEGKKAPRGRQAPCPNLIPGPHAQETVGPAGPAAALSILPSEAGEGSPAHVCGVAGELAQHVGQETATHLLRQHGAERCERNLHLVALRTAEGTAVQNRGGYLREAIEHDWAAGGDGPMAEWRALAREHNGALLYPPGSTDRYERWRLGMEDKPHGRIYVTHYHGHPRYLTEPGECREWLAALRPAAEQRSLP